LYLYRLVRNPEIRHPVGTNTLPGATMPHFVKSHGLGNDYIVMEPDKLPFPLTEANIRLICHRNLGVGSDGILAMTRPGRGDFGVRIYNPDGSEAEKSGNGTRIFAKYLYDYGYTTKTHFTIDTLGGLVSADVEVANGRVTGATMNLGPATILEPSEIEVDGERIAVICVSVGNPHCIVLTGDLAQVDFHRLGPKIENHPAFPNRTNVQFAQVMGRDAVQILIWERGAGETMASGSSASAVAAACRHAGLVDDDVSLRMAGGVLRIRTDAAGGLWMSGPVEEVCSGDLSPELLGRLAAGT
jgi:diaminopimelate epimerase